jgi:hypothetical protein
LTIRLHNVAITAIYLLPSPFNIGEEAFHPETMIQDDFVSCPQFFSKDLKEV